LLALSVLGALVLSSCSPPPPTPPPGPADVIDVEGLWLVTPGPGTTYGSGGATTLEFGAARSGSAKFLSRAAANGVLTCERHVYAALTDHVLLLDGTHYEAQTSGANEIELSTEDDRLTLTRVSGAAPVEPCLAANASEVQSFPFGVNGWTTLASVGSKLYFNTDGTGNPIVAYDLVTGVLGPERINPGSHDHLIAARSDNEFYGHCACGNITTLQRFDINTLTPLTTISTQNDLGIFMSAEMGLFDGTSLLLAGRDYENDGVNHVLTLHPDTLALQSQRDVLPEAFIRDLAWTGGTLVALIGHSIVYIGPTGMAEATIDLPDAVPDFPRGLAFNGGDFYVLASTADEEAVIFRISLP